MKQVLERYKESESDVQLHVRDKIVEGKIQALEDDLVHLLGDRFEYFVPIDHVLFVGAKLNADQQRRDKTVGFK